jgi:enamine deaminase RidA (YjgF/YER057c/UK114 family)
MFELLDNDGDLTDDLTGKEVTMKRGLIVVAVVATCWSATVRVAEAQTSVKHIQPGQGTIAQAVWAGDTLYLSGQTATPITPADSTKGTPAVYGNTNAQSMSVFSKIESGLKEQGLTMGDVVMMHVFLVGDPAMKGKMDFAGMNAAFTKFFGTKDQPNKPARTTVQIAALAAQGALVEIEAIAVRSKK